MKLSREYWGTVQDGYGSSSNWMPRYLPRLYPGTLNVKLEEEVNFSKDPKISWFKKFYTGENDERHPNQKIGRVAKCKINGVNAFLVNPPKISLDREGPLAEIGAKFNLREALNLSNGDRVWIKFYIK